MTETARIYGGSLYDLAAEENLTGEILGQMEQIRTLLRENPEYERLLSEPSIPQMERNGMIEAAFGGQAQRYLVNFMKLMCEKNLLGEYSGCFGRGSGRTGWKIAGRNGEEPDFGDFRQDSSCNSVGGKHATETRRNIQSHPKSDQVL